VDDHRGGLTRAQGTEWGRRTGSRWSWTASRGAERGHGAAAGTILRDDAPALVEPAEDPGATPGGDRGGQRDCGTRGAPAAGSLRFPKISNGSLLAPDSLRKGPGKCSRTAGRRSSWTVWIGLWSAWIPPDCRSVSVAAVRTSGASMQDRWHAGVY